MVYFTLTINSNEYKFSRIKYKREVGIQSQTMEIWANIAGSMFPNQGDLVKLTKNILGNTILRWQGRIDRIDYLPTNKGQVHIICYDMSRKIAYLQAANLGYASQTATSVFNTEAGPNSATTDLTIGANPGGDAIQDSLNFGKSLTGADSAISRDKIFEILEQVSGYDFFVHKSGTADFVPSAGNDLHNSIVLIDGQNGSLIDTGYSEDTTRIVKKVIVKGKGTGVLNGVIGAATDPSYATTDKTRQFQMPYLVSSLTCNEAAANLLTELNKTAIYAKFMLFDVIQIDYDIYDTVQLQARLQNKNVNTSLRIYSIEVEISESGDPQEKVTLELSNFHFGVFAPLIVQTSAGSASSSNLSLSSQVTQATDQIGSAGGSSIIEEDTSSGGGGIQNIITTTEIDIGASILIHSSPNIAGVNFVMNLAIIPRKFGTGFGLAEFRLYDGVSFYPTGSNRLQVQYDPTIATPTFTSTSIYIPVNEAGKTLKIYAIAHDGEFYLSVNWYIETIGLHNH
jgi:hypothetical protein